MWMLVHPTHLVLSFASLSNKIFCGSFLIENLAICVPTTLAKQVLFLNHINKKVVWGKHIVLVHYVNACAPDPSAVLLCNHFIWDILWFISDWKSCCLCAYHNSKMNSFLNQMNKKVVGGVHNVLIHYLDASAPDPSGTVLCIPFRWDILWFISDWKSCCLLCAHHISKTNFIPQPHGQKSCRRCT